MPRLVTLKNSVKPANLVIVCAAANTASEMGITLYVTSGNDSAHMKGSRHYTNQAIDFRTKAWNKQIYTEFIERLRKRLGPKYLVLHESVGKPNQHLHVEVN